MAYSSTHLAIRPSDGWTLAATNPKYLYVKSCVGTRFELAVLASGSPVAQSARATGNFTSSGNQLNTETATVGSVVYTFVAALAVANDVLIGATAQDTLNNLSAAINGGAGEGTLYGTGTVANSDATSFVSSATQIDISAIAPGAAGNSIAISETSLTLAASGATLAGGADATQGLLFGGQNAHAGARDFYEEANEGVTPTAHVVYVRINPQHVPKDDIYPICIVKDE